MSPRWVSCGGGGLSVVIGEDGLVYLVSPGSDGQPPHQHSLFADEIQELVRALVITRREAYGSYWA